MKIEEIKKHAPTLKDMKIHKDSCTWSLYDERAIVESLFNQRFNFFLVVYAIILNVGFRGSFFEQCFVLSCGLSLLGLCWLVIWRTHNRLRIILTFLYNIKKSNGKKANHPLKKLDYCISKERSFFNPRALFIQARIIPILCILSLVFLLCKTIFYDTRNTETTILQNLHPVLSVNDEVLNVVRDDGEATMEKMDSMR